MCMLRNATRVSSSFSAPSSLLLVLKWKKKNFSERKKRFYNAYRFRAQHYNCSRLVRIDVFTITHASRNPQCMCFGFGPRIAWFVSQSLSRFWDVNSTLIKNIFFFYEFRPAFRDYAQHGIYVFCKLAAVIIYMCYSPAGRSV